MGKGDSTRQIIISNSMTPIKTVRFNPSCKKCNEKFNWIYLILTLATMLMTTLCKNLIITMINKTMTGGISNIGRNIEIARKIIETLLKKWQNADLIIMMINKTRKGDLCASGHCSLAIWLHRSVICVNLVTPQKCFCYIYIFTSISSILLMFRRLISF